MSGQADTAPTSIDDVAQLLFDNPEADARAEDGEVAPNDDEPAIAENSELDAEDDPQTDPDAEDPEAEEAEEDPDAPNQSSGELIEITIKGADGGDVTEKVTLDELKSGYQRHSDYTRKTMELGERERQAFDVVEQRVAESRQHYLAEAQKAHQVIARLAGLKSPQEMAMLAQMDPNAWVAENARMQSIQAEMQQIEQGMRSEAQAGATQSEEAKRAEVTRAWTQLGEKGIDKPKLMEIFKGVHDTYGVPKEKFERVTDPALVEIMRDAMEFRALKSKTAAIKKTVEAAPRLPQARQPVPQQARANKQLDQRFSSGRANTRDLAKWLESNG